jgi:hypothetical protein
MVAYWKQFIGMITVPVWNMLDQWQPLGFDQVHKTLLGGGNTPVQMVLYCFCPVLQKRIPLGPQIIHNFCLAWQMSVFGKRACCCAGLVDVVDIKLTIVHIITNTALRVMYIWHCKYTYYFFTQVSILVYLINIVSLVMIRHKILILEHREDCYLFILKPRGNIPSHRDGGCTPESQG